MKRKLEPMANIYVAPTKYGLINILVSLHVEPDTVRALLRDAHAILDKMDAEAWVEQHGEDVNG